MDIVLLSIPRLSIEVPPLNISQLNSCVKSAGYSSTTIDANIELYHHLTFEEWLEVDDYFQTDLRYTGNDVSHFKRDIKFMEMHDEKLSTLKCRDKYLAFIESIAKRILEYSPEWVGISIFSVNSTLPGIDFCSAILKINPNQKIVLGGMGVSSFGVGTRPNYGEFMKVSGLAKDYISGEGEYAIIELLKTGESPFINPQIEVLDEIPFSDYTDLHLELYPAKDKFFYLTGSRGCVKQCTFCDIQSLWKKFRWRSAENLVAEFKHLYEKYGAKDFYFTDSLINGNTKEFNKFCSLIVEAKNSGELPEDLSFGGQWICRPKSTFSEDHYATASKAGLYNLSIGIESGSDSVLDSMKKSITREDYDFQMEMLDKYGIRCNFLMIIGYPSETEEDFQLTMDMFKDYKKYSDSGTIWGVNLGKTLVILPGAPIGQAPDDFGVHYDEHNNWYNPDIGLTYDVRLKRRLQAQLLLEELGYVIKSTVTTINSLYEIKMRGGYDSIA